MFSLYKNDLKTMSDILYRATKYMNAEDVLLAKEEKPKKWERQEDVRLDKGRKTTRTGDRQEDRRSKPPTRRFASFTSLAAPIDQVLMQIKDEAALTWPGKLKGNPSRDKYYRSHSSTVTTCLNVMTRSSIKAFIRQEKLQRFFIKESTDPP